MVVQNQHRIADTDMRSPVTTTTAVMAIAKRATMFLFPALTVALVGYLIAAHGTELGAALGSVSPWVLMAAVAAHLCTLALRTEAWRTVLKAAGGERISAQAVHAANA